MANAKPMTKADASRIQSATAKNHGGKIPKGSFAARAQAVADRSASKKGGPAGKPSTTGNPSGGGRDNAPPKK